MLQKKLQNQGVTKMSEFNIGDKVTYVPDFGYLESGIIKSICDNDSVFVVYTCDGNWEHYDNYTGFKTKIKDLIHGWGETMSDKLKPCHECGFDKIVTNQRVYKKEILPYRHRIYCCWCGRKTKSYETLNEAIKAWNSE